jgi:hypothetical protein
MSPIKALFSSRKFLLMLLDTIVSIALYFVGKYIPNAEADIKFVILGLQPVIISVIIAIAYEDAKIIPAQISLEEAKEYNKTSGQG